jgi:hypothetical protein
MDWLEGDNIGIDPNNDNSKVILKTPIIDNIIDCKIVFPPRDNFLYIILKETEENSDVLNNLFDNFESNSNYFNRVVLKVDNENNVGNVPSPPRINNVVLVLNHYDEDGNIDDTNEYILWFDDRDFGLEIEGDIKFDGSMLGYLKDNFKEFIIDTFYIENEDEEEKNAFVSIEVVNSGKLVLTGNVVDVRQEYSVIRLPYGCPFLLHRIYENADNSNIKFDIKLTSIDDDKEETRLEINSSTRIAITGIPDGKLEDILYDNLLKCQFNRDGDDTKLQVYSNCKEKGSGLIEVLGTDFRLANEYLGGLIPDTWVTIPNFSFRIEPETEFYCIADIYFTAEVATDMIMLLESLRIEIKDGEIYWNDATNFRYAINSMRTARLPSAVLHWTAVDGSIVVNNRFTNSGISYLPLYPPPPMSGESVENILRNLTHIRMTCSGSNIGAIGGFDVEFQFIQGSRGDIAFQPFSAIQIHTKRSNKQLI